MFRREDWHQFRTLETLPQKAGVPTRHLKRLALKELVDNALDAGADVSVREEDGLFIIEDDGVGMGSGENVADLFSIGRPMVSSKLLRLPTRGALGNGLRVVCGVLLVSGGSLNVETGGRRYRVDVKEDGFSEAHDEGPARQQDGTRIEVEFGAGLPEESEVRAWADAALELAHTGTDYRGRTSPHWYSAEDFYELCRSSTETVRELASRFEGLANVSRRVLGALASHPAASLVREDAAELHGLLRSRSRPVNPTRLGLLGQGAYPFNGGYAKTTGTFVRASTSGPPSTIPFVIEVWASAAKDSGVVATVNRTPIVGELESYHSKTLLRLYGLGLNGCAAKIGRAPIALQFNVQAPYLPKVNDGKTPDLSVVGSKLTRVIEVAARRVRRGSGGAARTTTKGRILKQIVAAAQHCSEGGTLRYSQRQLYYAVRARLGGADLNYSYFTQIVSKVLDSGGSLDGMYFDSRGSLQMPFVDGSIEVGTLSVEAYERPPWLFNKILYCEKEGLFPALRHARFPERHDCALLSSKGFASRAAAQLIEQLARSEEGVEVFCIHDADGPGTKIYEVLAHEVEVQRASNVDVINLGLDPEEALTMGLQVEEFTPRKKRTAVAEYIDAHRQEWLQSHRVELNAMTPAQLVTWLDGKMKLYADGKLIPPQAVLSEELDAHVRRLLVEKIETRILKSADAEAQIQAAVADLANSIEKEQPNLISAIDAAYQSDITQPWRDVIQDLAMSLVDAPDE